MFRAPLIASTLLLGSAVCLFASVDRELLSMAPPETTLLTGIDVAKTAATPFGQKVLANARTQDGNYQQFASVTGFDPTRDIQNVLLAGIASKDGPESRFAVLARGTFDVTKIQSAVQAKGAKLSTLNGITILTSASGNGGKQITVAFPQPSIAIMGDSATVREILSNNSGGATPDPKLLAQVNEIGPDNDVWFATLLSGNFIGNDVASAAPAGSSQLFNAQLLRSIIQSSGGIQFGNTVSVAVHLVTKSEADAQSVSDLLKFASNMLQMKQGDDPNLSIIAAALSTMQVQTTGSRVVASIAVDEKVLDHFITSRKPVN